LNPFLATAIVLILRWLQHIASAVTHPADESGGHRLLSLLQENADFIKRLRVYSLHSNDMRDEPPTTGRPQ
jgi:hypothetical protein